MLVGFRFLFWMKLVGPGLVWDRSVFVRVYITGKRG